MPTRLKTNQIYGPCHILKPCGKGIKIYGTCCYFQTALKLGIFSPVYIVESETLGERWNTGQSLSVPGYLSDRTFGEAKVSKALAYAHYFRTRQQEF